MDLNEHISKYLIGNSARYFSVGDPVRDLQDLIEFFRDVPLSFADPYVGREHRPLDEFEELANEFLEKVGYGEYLFTAIDYVPEYNLFLLEDMTEEQSDVLSASRTARLVIELGPDDEQPRLDLILKPETDEFHTVWGAHKWESEGVWYYDIHDASWLGMFYEVDGEERYLEIHFVPWLP